MLIRFSRIVAVVLIVPAIGVVVWGELSPGVGDPLQLWDKLLHFSAYFGLTALGSVAVGGRRRSVWVAIAFAGLGGVLEITQGFVGRDPDVFDEVANIVGAFGGTLAANLYLMAVFRLDRFFGTGPRAADRRVRVGSS